MRHTTTSFISSSLSLSTSVDLFFFHSLYLSFSLFASPFLFALPVSAPLFFSSPSRCSLREPAGKLALGYKLEAHNHMLDIFMEGVCVYVCRKKTGGGV